MSLILSRVFIIRFYSFNRFPYAPSTIYEIITFAAVNSNNVNEIHAKQPLICTSNHTPCMNNTIKTTTLCDIGTYVGYVLQKLVAISFSIGASTVFDETGHIVVLLSASQFPVGLLKFIQRCHMISCLKLLTQMGTTTP